VLLGEVAHCRFGDKGDTGLFVVAPYDPRDIEALAAALTPARVTAHMGGGEVVCRPSAELGAIVVVVRASLGGGVTASLALDAHGKTRSGILLGMRIPWEDDA
jgi:hypothetical protein